MLSGIQGHQVPVVGLYQVLLDICMQGGLFEGIFCRLAVNKTGAFPAQEVPDQNTSLAMDKTVNRYSLLAFDPDRANRPCPTAGTQIAVIQPEGFDGIAPLPFSLGRHDTKDFLRCYPGIVFFPFGFFRFHDLTFLESEK